MLVVSVFLSGMAANSQQATGWKAYKLDVENVRACVFTPDGHSVAFVYLTDHLLSEKPWHVTYTSHLALWNLETGNVEEKSKWEYTSTEQGDPWPSQPRYAAYTANGNYLVVFDPATLRVLDARTYAEVKRVNYEEPKETFPNDGWAIADFSLAADGSRVAIGISSTIGANGGFVRVYDLGTGQVVREWRLHDGVRYVTGAALSQDGDRETFIPVGVDNVRVMDDHRSEHGLLVRHDQSVGLANRQTAARDHQPSHGRALSVGPFPGWKADSGILRNRKAG